MIEVVVDTWDVGASVVLVEGIAVEVEVGASVVLVERKAVDDDVVVGLPVLVLV